MAWFLIKLPYGVMPDFEVGGQNWRKPGSLSSLKPHFTHEKAAIEKAGVLKVYTSF